METSFATAAEIRARLEATDQLSEEDAALIKTFRQVPLTVDFSFE